MPQFLYRGFYLWAALSLSLTFPTSQAEDATKINWTYITTVAPTTFTPPESCASATFWFSTTTRVPSADSNPADFVDAELLMYKAGCLADINCCPEGYVVNDGDADTDSDTPVPIYKPGVCPSGYINIGDDARSVEQDEASGTHYCCPSSLAPTIPHTAGCPAICASTSTEYGSIVADDTTLSYQTLHVVAATPIYVVPPPSSEFLVPRDTPQITPAESTPFWWIGILSVLVFAVCFVAFFWCRFRREENRNRGNQNQGNQNQGNQNQGNQNQGNQNSSSMQLGPVTHGAQNQPQANQPQANQPQANQPQANQPQANQPQANQPQANQPQANQPQVNQPQANQPQVNQPQANQPQGNQAQEDRAQGGDQAGGDQAGGDQAEGNQVEGGQAEENQAERGQAEGNQAEENQAEGEQAEENQAEGEQSEEEQAEENQAEGEQVEGEQPPPRDPPRYGDLPAPDYHPTSGPDDVQDDAVDRVNTQSRQHHFRHSPGQTRSRSRLPPPGGSFLR
ncbi:hypothetical protein TWF730_007880 [Orbilia blumenaviensis]|uniref:Uncharacterized protein n=1 Tax=Orbilia blumenaviensis TaxID=1796055 RepID=A0AAV9VCE5_9PEZI